jgi:hypothetical protein
MSTEPSKIVEFEIGEAFPADDPVARWLTALSISHNDIRHGNLRLVEPDQPAHEAIYYFRLVASHFKEIAEDLDQAYADWPEVKQFVDGLPTDALADFRTVLEVASNLEVDLGRLRNTSFHYPQLDKRKAAKGREKLQQAMQNAAGLSSRITVGPRFGDVRLDFADEVVVQFIGEDDVARPLMHQLQQGVLAFWRFCHHALDAYLRALPSANLTVSLDVAE